MRSITIKKHKVYEYKGLKIGIWHTKNKKFIDNTWASSWVDNGYYRNEEDKKKKKNFKGLYFWDCNTPNGNLYNGLFDDNTLEAAGFFKLTEEEAIEKAKKVIDESLEAVGIEFIDPNMPSHIYDPETGSIMRRWCLLSEYPDHDPDYEYSSDDSSSEYEPIDPLLEIIAMQEQSFWGDMEQFGEYRPQ